MMYHDLLAQEGPEATAGPVRMPVGRAGQLQVLRRQLSVCEQAISVAQKRLADSMVDEDGDDSRRWLAVRGSRAVVHKIQRQILPLVDRVPMWLRTDPEYVECQRVAHVLRRSAEAALRDSTNYTVDLVNAQPLMAR